METIFDVLDFLNKMEVAFYLSIKDHENLVRVEEVIINLFQYVNSEKLKSVLETVREIEILSGAGNWHEIRDVNKILREDVKRLYKEYRIKNIQIEIE